MEGICDVILNVPEDIQACKDTIDQLIPQLIEAIIRDWGNPDAICENVGLCPWNLWIYYFIKS